jgi:hypothetical protein
MIFALTPAPNKAKKGAAPEYRTRKTLNSFAATQILVPTMRKQDGESVFAIGKTLSHCRNY